MAELATILDATVLNANPEFFIAVGAIVVFLGYMFLPEIREMVGIETNPPPKYKAHREK